MEVLIFGTAVCSRLVSGLAANELRHRSIDHCLPVQSLIHRSGIALELEVACLLS